jgi:hypothetical protein
MFYRSLRALFRLKQLLRYQEELMLKKFWVTLMSLVCAAHVQAIGPGNLGSADNQTFLIAAAHSGTFIDAYQFDVSGGGFAGGALFGTVGNVAIEGVFFFDALDNVIGFDINGSDGFFATAMLAKAGTYRFAVFGGGAAGSYDGVLQTIIPVPVPEPSTYALMFTGVGVVGWITRRRSRDSGSVHRRNTDL